MSLREDGQCLLCDGEDCRALTAIPVALRPTLAAEAQASPAAKGWLFVLTQGKPLHFCPLCARKHLEKHARDPG